MNVPPPDLAGLVGYVKCLGWSLYECPLPDLARLVGYGRCLGWSLYECPPPGPDPFSGVWELCRMVL